MFLVSDPPRDILLRVLSADLALRMDACLTTAAGLRSSEVHSTLMMGATLIMVSMPKPWDALTALLKPMPMARTKGTVTGPARRGRGRGRGV